MMYSTIYCINHVARNIRFVFGGNKFKEIVLMKKRLSLVCVFIMVFTLVSCGVESPEQAVNNALTAVKKSDEDTIEKYFGEDDLLDSEDVDDDIEDIIDTDESSKLLFEKLSFDVLSSEIDGDRAVVETEITNIDLQSIFIEYLEESFDIIMARAFDAEADEDDEELEEELEQLFINLLSDEDNELLTSTVDINLLKDENGWKIDLDDDLLDAIFGGLFSMIDGMDLEDFY